MQAKHFKNNNNLRVSCAWQWVLLCDDDYDDDDDIHTQDGSLAIRHSSACAGFINKHSECNQRTPHIAYPHIQSILVGAHCSLLLLLVKC